MPKQMIFLLLFLAHFVWGGGFIVLKLVMGDLHISQVLLGRVMLAALIYVIIWKKIPKPDYQKGDWKYLLLLALCEPFLLFSFETLGLSYTTASQAGMIVGCTPLLVALGALVLYGERLSKRCISGILMAVTGVIIVSALGGATVDAPNPLLGNFFMLCAVLSAACYSLTVKFLAQRYSFLFLSAVQVFGATVLFLPVALSKPLPTEISWMSVAGMLYMGIGITFLVYLIINYALTQVKAAHVMLFSNLIPISTLILAFVVLGERLSAVQYCGAALVLGGMMFAGMPESVHDSGDAQTEIQEQQVSA